MRILNRVSAGLAAVLLAVVLLVGGFCPPARAERAPPPSYLHALADLRMARALLEHPGEQGGGDQAQALSEIDRAIDETRRAAVDDGQNAGWNPPVDIRLERHDRLDQARRLLDAAAHDLDGVEDKPEALDWRDSARRHVDQARRMVERARTAPAD